MPVPVLSILVLLFTFLTTEAAAQWNPLNPVLSVRRDGNSAVLAMETGVLRVQVCTERIIRIVYSPSPVVPPRTEDLVIKSSWPEVDWTLSSTPDSVVVGTSALSVRIARSNGTITFQDREGTRLFEDDGRTLTGVVVNGEATYHAEMFSRLWGSSEAFYGLGSHQAGVWNYRGEAVDISQDNTNIGIPVFVSSNGYGILWNNASRSRFDNRFLQALYLSSEVADAIDYYFLYGPEFDDMIAAYRELTGDAPLFGKWAYGFWQCKNRYATQNELLGIAHRYRELHIPADGIVQDWFWWRTMGEPVFDSARYPSPQTMIEDLHGSHFHFMISSWPFFRPGTGTYDDMDRRGFFVAKTIVAAFHPAGQALYDAFNAQARGYYWGLLDTALFRIGTDAWWLDTTEPETEGRATNILVTSRVAAGSGARYANMYPLMATTAVYAGQRAETDRKRVFILSRSAYAGSQRTAAAVWSGDVNADWTFFRKQVPAGLNYAVSGLPYWTTDIGGFVLGHPDDTDYRELFVRWFQFGAFNPIFRVHGTRSPDQNELWSYGPEAQAILTAFDRLRYRLLPYVYSVAWMTTHSRYTPMRPLVMDFRTDARAASVGDQFMFGPAVLVNPVLEPAARSRRLYLPHARWYDFWTGRSFDGGRTIDAEAPLERIPLFVRAGAILPLGPDVEWATEKPADPLEVRVYRGADGSFTLYEDEGDSYDYEKGAYATIRFDWNESRGALTIGDRQGRFPGMPDSRTFRIVFVDEHHGIGIDPTTTADREVRYSGERLVVTP
jgi:alpha-D-xyloside xylohydrolase